MKLYPLCLKLKGVCCLVVGGGNVALRKVKSLLECEARLTVVSPELCPGLERLRQKKLFYFRKTVYQKSFLKDIFLVIAAADNKQINARIARDCRQKGILVNVVDAPELCDFFVPSVFRKGALLVSIATQGEFPGIAKKMRKELSGYFSQYSLHLKRLSGLRRKIKQKYEDKTIRKRIIKKLL